MRYGITFLEGQYKELQEHLFEGATTERAAYMLCGVVAAGEETRLLVREIHPLGADEVESATPSSMSILSWSYVRQLKRADERSAALVFVHSHPEGHAGFSRADDENERALFATAHIRVASVKVHASLVFAGPDKPFGRVWLDGGATCAVETIRVVGERFSFLRASQDDGETSVADRPLEDFAVFDRQARAFGGGLQPTLSALKVGIVGAGGTGSSVAEQLIRLGVGHLVVIDE
ncbi:MAG: ThiF family adenylyltransferase, partial [Dehalococcoidia bacterium]